MGKSFVADCFMEQGAVVFNADEEVHKLLGQGGDAVISVSEYFPEAYSEGHIDRKILGEMVFGDREKLAALEAILHPLVRVAEKKFLRLAKIKKRTHAILEIPLLFETGRDNDCDAVIVVRANKHVQKSRVLKRPGMTKERLKEVLALQMPSSDKVKLADYVINTGLSKQKVVAQVQRIMKQSTMRTKAALDEA
jgi:dephospho-CoA kinase